MDNGDQSKIHIPRVASILACDGKSWSQLIDGQRQVAISSMMMSGVDRRVGVGPCTCKNTRTENAGSEWLSVLNLLYFLSMEQKQFDNPCLLKMGTRHKSKLGLVSWHEDRSQARSPREPRFSFDVASWVSARSVHEQHVAEEKLLQEVMTNWHLWHLVNSWRSVNLKHLLCGDQENCQDSDVHLRLYKSIYTV